MPRSSFPNRLKSASLTSHICLLCCMPSFASTGCMLTCPEHQPPTTIWTKTVRVFTRTSGLQAALVAFLRMQANKQATISMKVCVFLSNQTCLIMHCPALHQVDAQFTCSGCQQCLQRLRAAIASAAWRDICKAVTASLTCPGCQTCPQPCWHGFQGPPWSWPPQDESAPQRCLRCRRPSEQ